MFLWLDHLFQPIYDEVVGSDATPWLVIRQVDSQIDHESVLIK
jgi:hypothetical protein